MASHRRIVKRLSYRDQTGASQAAHREHWRGFEWDAGPVVVSYVGFWGEVQVWAATEAEGRRVILHACAIAGIPTTGVQAGEWLAATVKPGRNGTVARVSVPIVDGFPHVTKRAGPSGPAYL